jgi:hypothetical protein
MKTSSFSPRPGYARTRNIILQSQKQTCFGEPLGGEILCDGGWQDTGSQDEL